MWKSLIILVMEDNQLTFTNKLNLIETKIKFKNNNKRRKPDIYPVDLRKKVGWCQKRQFHLAIGNKILLGILHTKQQNGLDLDLDYDG